MPNFKNGDTAYAGYPSAHIHNYARNDKGKLVLKKVKHLLWGDWISVRDYSYIDDPEADIRTAAERAFAKKTPDGMIPVRARGQSGFIPEEDLIKDQLLEVIFVDVGQGDGALLITPDDKKYVIDAGERDNMYRYLKWRFSGFKNQQDDFDGFIITHPDKDHYAGFNPLVDDEKVTAANIWHNGMVEQFSVNAAGAQSGAKEVALGASSVSGGQRFITGLVETDSALKSLLSDEGRWIKKSTGNPKMYPDLLNSAQTAKSGAKRRFKKISMLSTRHGEMHDGVSYLPGHAPDGASPCEIKILGPVVEPDGDGTDRLRTFTTKPMEKTKTINTGKTKNGHSVLLQLTYGRVSMMFGGDLNSSSEMFLMHHYTGLPVYDAAEVTEDEILDAARPIFGVDVAKSCHHGSADFTDVFLKSVNAAATVVSSGDEEGHAHPRSDTLGAIGHNGRGRRSLIFATELMRSTKEFTDREDTPWFQAHELKLKAAKEDDAATRKQLEDEAEDLLETDKKRNVTVYGAINVRSDGEKVVLAYMLERPSDSKRWDIYPLESINNGPLHYINVKEAEKREEKRRQERDA